MSVRLLSGDCREVLRSLPDASAQMCVTSPPYFGLRDYGVDGQIGLEPTPDAYVAELVTVFREVRRVLRDDGTLWLNLGDSYATYRNDNDWLGSGALGRKGKFVPPGCKPKDLIGIPWRVAFSLQADGWWLRSEIIWHKPNPMPESVRDRPTKAHEQVFLLTKAPSYYYDAPAIAEAHTSNFLRLPGPTRDNGVQAAYRGNAPRLQRTKERTGHPEGRNARTVWTIATQPFAEAHFATFPPELAERCIKAGSRPGDTVLDPFGGAGTTGLVVDRLGRDAILIELNPSYAGIAESRIRRDAGLFADVT